MAGALGSRKAAVLCLTVSIVIMLSVAALIINGVIELGSPKLELSDDWEDWFHYPIVLVVFSAVMVLTTDLLLSRLAKSLATTQGLVRDFREEIDVREKTQRELEKSEQQYKLLADNVHDVVWTTTLDVKLTYISPSIYKQRGFTVEEFIELSLDETLTQDTVPIVRDVLREEMELEKSPSASPDRSRTLEYRVKCKNGSVLWVEGVTTVLRDEEGKATGILGVTRDISDRKRAESERAAIESQMRDAQKMESLGVLAGGIAHDFNNLLVGILGNADLALMNLDDPEETRRRLQQLVVSSESASELCNQLLAYSGRGKIRGGSIEVGQTCQGDV